MTRLRGLVVVLALALSLGVHAASAATIDAPEGRAFEAILVGTGSSFRVPLVFGEPGLVYVKLLPTDANAALADGARNGTWRVDAALARADGAMESLGDLADGAPSRSVPVKSGDARVLVVDVSVPPDAKDGARVILAVALRAPGSPGEASGATQDAAVAITLVPKVAVAALPAPDEPARSLVPGPTGGPDAGTSSVLVVQAQVPMWILVAVVGVLVSALAVLAAALVVMRATMRELRSAREASAVRVPVEDRDAQTSKTATQARR